MSDVIQSDRAVTQSILWVETLIDDVEAIDRAIAARRLASSADLRAKLDVAREALRKIIADFETDYCIEGVIVDDPDASLILNWRLATAALATIGGTNEQG